MHSRPGADEFARLRTVRVGGIDGGANPGSHHYHTGVNWVAVGQKNVDRLDFKRISRTGGRRGAVFGRVLEFGNVPARKAWRAGTRVY